REGHDEAQRPRWPGLRERALADYEQEEKERDNPLHTFTLPASHSSASIHCPCSVHSGDARRTKRPAILSGALMLIGSSSGAARARISVRVGPGLTMLTRTGEPPFSAM